MNTAGRTPEASEGDTDAATQVDPPPFTAEQFAWIDRLIVNRQEQRSGQEHTRTQAAAPGDPLPPPATGETSAVGV